MVLVSRSAGLSCAPPSRRAPSLTCPLFERCKSNVLLRPSENNVGGVDSGAPGDRASGSDTHRGTYEVYLLS